MAKPLRLSTLLARAGVAHHLLAGDVGRDVAAGALPDVEELTDPLVTGVVEDSREVVAGSLFCCLPGAAHDGHRFAAEAVGRGAAALVVERPLHTGAAEHAVHAGPVGHAGHLAVAQVVVADARAAVGPLALAALGQPQQHLALVGVTGTNGKTTVTHLLGAILDAAGRRCAVIGTLDGGLTTPSATRLAAELAAAQAAGATSVALEVTSHALVQKRVEGLRFAAAAFTNLSADHLDYHADMEAYFAAKKQLFAAERTATAVICTDSDWGERLAGELQNTLEGGVRRCSGAEAQVLATDAHGTRFRLGGQEVRLPLGNPVNVTNAVIAAATAEALGVDAGAIREGLQRPPVLPGRFEVVSAGAPAHTAPGMASSRNAAAAATAGEPTSDEAEPDNKDDGAPLVIVDFAHTPAALEAVLGAGRALVRNGSALTVVFGCGGRRDRAKRPHMGAVAARLADSVFVTSDNPRDEDPQQITAEILAGAGAAAGAAGANRGTAAVRSEIDRRRAIAAALDGAGPGDVVIVAGKGHETVQVVGATERPFDDRVVVRELLAARRSGKGGQR